MLLVFGFTGYRAMAQTERKAMRDSGTAGTAFNSVKTLKKAEKRKMLRELNLTKEQSSRLREIKQENRAEQQTVINDTALSEDQKREKLKHIKKAGAANLQSVLNAEQKAKMNAIRRERRSTDKQNKSSEE